MVPLVDDFVIYDDRKIKWSRDLKLDLKRGHYAEYSEKKVRQALYRPFCKQWLFFDRILNEEIYQLTQLFPPPTTETENLVICLTDIASEKPFMVMVTNIIPDLHLVSPGSNAQCFPYYTFAEQGSPRRENITDWALGQFQSRYGQQITKRDIFHYVYAMLHHPQYRKRYAENLKWDLPRIPLLNERSAFETCVRIGRQLMELHLNYEQVSEYRLKWIENRDVPVNWRVEKMRLTPNKEAAVVNEWLTLSGIPQECFQYRLGSRSALEWVIDQYQVGTDARSGITSDPNREDEPEYIVRLVGRAVTVSVETVKLVDELAKAITQEDWMEEAVITS